MEKKRIKLILKKKRVEFEKGELIFLLNILEDLADDLYETDLMDEEEENQIKIEYINKIYNKLNQKFQEM